MAKIAPNTSADMEPHCKLLLCHCGLVAKMAMKANISSGLSCPGIEYNIVLLVLRPGLPS